MLGWDRPRIEEASPNSFRGMEKQRASYRDGESARVPCFTPRIRLSGRATGTSAAACATGGPICARPFLVAAVNRLN